MKLAGYKGQRLNRKDKEMKLRNKKTGEVLRLGSFIVQNPNHINCENITKYDSLAELNEEWEDYEEPKASMHVTGPVEKDDNTVLIEFYTHEEAEKVVEKLKAWKRLKDARFEFGTIKYNLDEESSSLIAYDGIITIKGMAYEDFVDDLDLLFGGEE